MKYTECEFYKIGNCIISKDPMKCDKELGFDCDKWDEAQEEYMEVQP